MKQFISGLWNKRYMNSAERYARREKIAEICCAIAFIGLVLALCLMLLFKV